MPSPRQQLADVVDILYIVFDSLQQDIEAGAEAGAARVALARSASVCRLFYELAVPMLWRRIPGEPIFALPQAYGFVERKMLVIQDDHGDRQTVYRRVLAMPAGDVLAHQNWKRFLAYTRHVRTIDSLSMTDLSVWEDLVRTQPATGHVILPRLVKMSVDIKFPTDRYCEPALVAMFGSAPNLTDLSLLYTLAYCDLRSIADMLYPPTQTIPIVPILAHLRSLTVRDSVGLESEDVVTMARRWPNAEEIRWEAPCGSMKAGLWSIQTFAMHCPQLRVLRLPSTVMNDLVPCLVSLLPTTKTTLVEVAIGGRPIQEYAAESARVREFVECVFPGLLTD